ncbi:hypothetical protein QQ045_022807 [Rhodiola kirilowii]
MEDYGFEYSDEEPEEQDIDIENQYYHSEGLVETDPEVELAGFVQMEPAKAECNVELKKINWFQWPPVALLYRVREYQGAYKVGFAGIGVGAAYYMVSGQLWSSMTFKFSLKVIFYNLSMI